MLCVAGPAALRRTGGTASCVIEAVDETGAPARADAPAGSSALLGAAVLDRLPPGPGHAPLRLLAAVDAQGQEAIARVGGAFVCAVWQAQSQSLRLAIDRAGIGQLFWTQTADQSVLAATRLTHLVAQPEIDAKLDPVGLNHYLVYYAVPGPGTIYRDIQRLGPGQCLTVQDGQARTHRYWQMPYAATDAAEPELQHRLRTHLDDAVARALSGTHAATTGCFLSGGLDSSTVTGLVARQRPPAHSFTIRFHEPRYDEGRYAQLAADRFATRHHERYVDPADVADRLETIAGFLDQPYGNSSAVAAYHCALAAREAGMTLLLAGDGGDELFAGNERYLTLRRAELYGRIPSPARAVLDPMLAWPGLDRLPLLGKAHRLRARFHMDLSERLYDGQDPRRRFGRDGVLTADLVAMIGAHEPLALARAAADAAGPTADTVQRMMAVDLQLTIADNDLIKVNEMCALAGIQVRYPMLDDQLMDFAASLPEGTLLPGGRLRGFYKDSVADLLPRAILTKPKHGFGLPFKEWMGQAGPVQDCLLAALDQLVHRQLFQPDYLAALRRACTGADPGGLRGHAWDAAMLELWLSTHPGTV